MKGRFLMRLAGRDDSGFTLVETLVALVVATVVFTSLAYVAIGALRASMLSRTNQQAVDLADQRIEQLRDLPFTGVAMDSADLTGDPNIVACGAYKCVALGDGTQERVYTAAGGITPHTQSVTSTTTNNVTFTVRTYVTTPASDGSGSVYRRISVQVSWNQGETTLTRWVSSIVAYSQRGLPLPVFKLTPIGATTASVTANGSQAVYGFSLNNQGARDAWNLTMSGTRDWTFYLDDGDGVFDAGDTVMTDHTSDLKIDTDYLSPTESVRFWVVSTVATGSATGSTDYTLTAKSVLQPSAASGTLTSTMTLTILAVGATASPTTTPTTPGPTGTAAPTTCAASSVPAYTAPSGYTNVAFSLHNRSAANPAWPPAPYPATDPIASTSTVTQGIPMVMANDGFAVPSGRAMPVYSSNIVATAEGRVLNTGGSATTNDTTKVVDWRANIDKKGYSGSAVLTFWVGAVPGDSLSTVTLQTQLYKWVKSGSSYVQTNLGTPVTLTINPFTCAGLQQVVASFTGSQVTTGNLAANEYLGVRVWNTGSSRVRLGYDVTGAYPATLTVPWK